MVDTKRIVITGAGGHVGGRLLKHFCTATHHRVRPHFRTAPSMPPWASNCDPALGDLGDATTRRAVVSSADIVVHLATRGYSSLRPPSTDELEAENAITTALVQDSKTAGVSQFILISSIHVFGDALVGDVTELTLPAPSSDYGRSRLRLEENVHDLSSTSTMNSLVLRMTNTFGAPVFPQNATWNLLIHDLCRQAVTSDRLVLNTNGLGYRNVLPLHDATNAIAQISTGALPSGTYLLAGPKTYQIREIASLVKTRAEFILQKPIALDFDHSDVTAHRYFTVHSTSLGIHGVTIGDSLVNELDELIRTAYTQFCRVST
ncbi:MAG: NAD-dependent epimerase/dehydratase family protein [Ilumatobacteraceae bacterium]